MKNDQRTDEEAVIRQCLEGDADAYAVLVDRYQGMVYNVAFRILGDGDAAKDIAQDSFIAAYAGLRQFRFNAKFSSWLYSIVVNKCRDHLRLAKETVSTDDVAGVLTARGPSPEKAASAHQGGDLLQRALDAIPTDYREVIVLKHIEELDYQEIASITGISIAALKVRAHRAREMLRKILEEAGVTHGE